MASNRLPPAGWSPDPGPAPTSLFASRPPVPMNMAGFYYWLRSYAVTLVCAGCGGDVTCICGGCTTAWCGACGRDRALHPHVFGEAG